MTLRGLQPEHERYWLAYRLWLEDGCRESWPELMSMSLNQLDLLNLALDAKAAARQRKD